MLPADLALRTDPEFRKWAQVSYRTMPRAVYRL